MNMHRNSNLGAPTVSPLREVHACNGLPSSTCLSRHLSQGVRLHVLQDARRDTAGNNAKVRDARSESGLTALLRAVKELEQEEEEVNVAQRRLVFVRASDIRRTRRNRDIDGQDLDSSLVDLASRWQSSHKSEV